SPAKFQLSLLGRFSLFGPKGPIDVRGHKVAGLLAILALAAPEPQKRETLATMFWGSHFETQARQNLRQALRRLRVILGDDAIVSDDETVHLRADIVATDVVRFQRLARGQSREAQVEATNLYKGRFLADVTVSQEAWLDWLAAERG